LVDHDGEPKSGEPLEHAADSQPRSEALGDLAQDLASTSLTLARRFAAGATLWCTAPAWPAHARHIAVEFVHPVIVGKKALPAVAVPGPDPVGSLRQLGRPGDVVVAVAAADDPVVADVMRRAGAWGLVTVWIGMGDRVPTGAADQVLWLPDVDPLAPYGGRFVLLYHLLWELTHVCFEHPGLLVETPESCEVGEVCVTCSDEGRLGEVVEVGAGDEASVRTATGTEPVDTSIVGAVLPGDLILVHAGTAITIVDQG